MDTLRAGLWRGRGALPALLAIPTLLLYWTVPEPGTPADGANLLERLDPWLWVILAGAVVGLVIYLICSYIAGLSSTASRVNRHLYDRQRGRLSQIQQAVEVLEPPEPKPGDPPSADRRLAWEQASASASRVKEALDSTVPSQAWASGERYASQWIEIHRAEEAIILLSSAGTVRAEALIDQQRLDGSKISGRQDLRGLLDDAIEALDAGDEAPARAAARRVRRAINDYRDERGAGFFRLTFRLRSWQLILGLVVYGLFALAVLAIPRETELVMSFAAYFLVGAAAGLLFEAWNTQPDRPVVEDYGATRARFFLVPLISGVAASAGAFLVGALAGNPLAAVVAASESFDPGALTVVAAPALLVVAAIFGLAPGKLISALQAMGDRLESDLSASEPTGDGG